MATQADVYKGYYIPKNALVIGNSWYVYLIIPCSSALVLTNCRCARAILHDPVTYPDPETFNPSRFLTPDGTRINPDVQDPEVAFGYGRRICPVSLCLPPMPCDSL